MSDKKEVIDEVENSEEKNQPPIKKKAVKKKSPKKKAAKKNSKKNAKKKKGVKDLKVVGSLSELLTAKIKETVPKIKKTVPLMLIAGVNKGDHEKVKGKTLRVLSRAALRAREEKRRARDMPADPDPANPMIYVISEQARQSTEEWTALEGYCKTMEYKLLGSDQEMINILERLVGDST